jgi:hypothetical protein
METLERAIRKNEGDFRNQLYGQKVMAGQAWPWM